MATLTIEAIRKNPWNVMEGDFPARPTRTFLAIAYLAAKYCHDSELYLMNAARAGRYIPVTWMPNGCCPDVHEESEAVSFLAECRMGEIAALGMTLIIG